MHHSVYEEGTGFKVERCTACCKLFHCPLCPKFKPSQRARLQRHLVVHVKNAITFKDKKICKCNLNCRNTAHFHCPMCNNTIIRRTDTERHLETCQGATEQTLTSAPAPPKQDPGTSATPSPLLPPSTILPVSSISNLIVPPPQEDIKVHAATSTHVTEPSAKPLSGDTLGTCTAQDTTRILLKNKVQCPHCKLICYKKNLAKHIQRKHMKKEDATVSDTLKSVCADATNGLSAVEKARHGFSVPIHVQKNPPGHQHKVQCDLEDGRQYNLMASQSGFKLSQCEHIRSLEHESTQAEIYYFIF